MSEARKASAGDMLFRELEVYMEAVRNRDWGKAEFWPSEVFVAMAALMYEPDFMELLKESYHDCGMTAERADLTANVVGVFLSAVTRYCKQQEGAEPPGAAEKVCDLCNAAIDPAKPHQCSICGRYACGQCAMVMRHKTTGEVRLACKACAEGPRGRTGRKAKSR